jgi:peptidoglycan/LPS O-acetylase OafA/YrhL
MANGERGAPGTGRLVGMNGLRGVAALAILTTHVWDFGTPDPLHTTVNGGGRIDVGFLHPGFAVLGLAVALFFTLSGFLLYRSFSASIIGVSKRPSVREYTRARIFRIVPAYWVILGIVGVVFSAALVRTANGDLAVGNLASHPRAMAADYLFTQNYVPATNITGIGSTWTLLNEAVFYLVLPLLSLPLIRLAVRAGSQRIRIALAFAAPLTLLLIGLACKRYGQVHLGLDPDGGWHADWSSVFQRSFFYQADLFAAGMSAAVISVLLEHGTLHISRMLRTLALIASAGIFLVIPALGRHGSYPATFVSTTVSISFGLLLIGLVTTGERSRLASVLQWRPLASVGLISYSLFLWHEPVIRWLNTHDLTHSGRLGLGINILLAASISLSLATITYLLVERPFMALRKRSSARAQRPVSAPAPADAVAAPADAA